MTAGNMSSEKTKMIRQSGLQNKSLGLQRLLFTLKSHSTLDPTVGGVGGRDVLTYVPQPLWEGLGQASSSYFCWPNHSSTTTCCCQGPPSPLLGLTFGSDILPRGTLLKIACLCWQVALKRELSCLGEEGASFFFRSNLENYRFPVGKNMIISY